MARTRSRTRAAAKASEPTQTAAAQTADDEHDLEPDSGGNADDRPGIRITEADFDGPGVLDMSKHPGVEDASTSAGPDEDEDDEDDEEKPTPKAKRPAKAAAKAPAPARGRVRVRLVGLRSAPRAKPPYGVTIVVPFDDVDDQDPSHDGIHTQGETVQFTRGRSTSISARAFGWLSDHPEYIVEKV